MKKCSKCGQLKPLEAFGKARTCKDGHRSQCKECWVPYHRAYNEKHRDRLSVQRKEAHLRREYGLSLEDYWKLIVLQGNRCAVCGGMEPGGTSGEWNVDHSHEMDQVRGLVCWSCNVLLGMCHENPEILKAALRYLEEYLVER